MLRISGDNEDWSVQLLRMYLRWAEARYGPKDLNAFEASARNIRQNAHYARIPGLGAFGRLQEEAGLHLLCDPALSSSLVSARVEVWPYCEHLLREASFNDDIVVTTRAARVGRSCFGNSTRQFAAEARHLPTEWRHRALVEERRFSISERSARYIVQAQLFSDALPDAEERATRKKRTYHLPESYARDHLTALEDGSPKAVLDGALDPFLRMSLYQQLSALTPPAQQSGLVDRLAASVEAAPPLPASINARMKS